MPLLQLPAPVCLLFLIQDLLDFSQILVWFSLYYIILYSVYIFLSQSGMQRMGSGWSGSCVTQVPERWQSSRPPICGFICLQFIPEQLGLTIQLECVQGIQMYLSAMHSPFRKVMPLCIHCLTYIKPKQKSFCSCAFMEFFHHLRELGNG